MCVRCISVERYSMAKEENDGQENDKGHGKFTLQSQKKRFLPTNVRGMEYQDRLMQCQ